MQLNLSSKIYCHQAVLKTIYLYKENFNIKIDIKDEEFILNIYPIQNANFNENTFIKTLQEQQLREDLNKDFGELRNRIYEKAFSMVTK